MAYHIPLIIRGRIIEDRDLEFGGRRGGVAFTTADVRKHLAELPLSVRSRLAELHAVPFEEILDYLDSLGHCLDLKKNPYLQEAFELSSQTSGLSIDVIRNFYSTIGLMYRREAVREHAENTIGVK